LLRGLSLPPPINIRLRYFCKLRAWDVSQIGL
jgi:hypothetical protein